MVLTSVTVPKGRSKSETFPKLSSNRSRWACANAEVCWLVRTINGKSDQGGWRETQLFKLLQFSRMNASSATNAAPAPSISLQHNSSRSRQITQATPAASSSCAAALASRPIGAKMRSRCSKPLLPAFISVPLKQRFWSANVCRSARENAAEISERRSCRHPVGG